MFLFELLTFDFYYYTDYPRKHLYFLNDVFLFFHPRVIRDLVAKYSRPDRGRSPENPEPLRLGLDSRRWGGSNKGGV